MSKVHTFAQQAPVRRIGPRIVEDRMFNFNQQLAFRFIKSMYVACTWTVPYISPFFAK
jgi:hypothetical protein